jgi:arylformamidase
VPDFEDHIAEMQARSAAARSRLEATAAVRYDVRYGDGPRETLDLFPAADPGGPVNVFVHGGYWRALDKADHSYIAPPLVDAGACVVMLNYDLCPAVRLDEIVDQIVRGVAWVARNAADLGVDGARLFVSGHSAGAHLAAMAAGHDWRVEGLPEDQIKGAVLVSGIYDPEPVLHIPVNEEIGLTEDVAGRTNACARPATCPAVIAVGADEPAGWIAQSRAYHAAVGDDAEFMAIDGTHHFTVALTLADPEAPLGGAVIAQMGLAAQSRGAVV